VSIDQVSDDVLQHGADVAGLPPWQRADVQPEVHPVGNDVDLGAGVHDGGGHCDVGAGVGLAGQADEWQLVAERVDAFGVEQRAGELRREPDALDEPGPRLVELGLRPVGVNPPDHLGRLHQGIVGAEGLASVPRGSLDGESTPVDALLADDHRETGCAVGTAHGKSTRFGDHVIGAHVVCGVLAQPSGPVGAEGLLVGDRDVGEVTRRPEPGEGEVA
jgi:hypothetical protein